MQTIFSQFESSVRQFSKKDAIGFFKEDQLVYWSYEELHDKVMAVSESLRKHHLKKGDRLALLAPNGPEWGLIYLAAARLGLVVIPIHTTLSGTQIRLIIQQSRTKVLVLGKTGLTESFNELQEILPGLSAEILKNIAGNLPTVKIIILLEDPEKRLQDRKLTHYLFELLAHGNLLLEIRETVKKKGPRPVSVRPDDLFTIMYTSGTTGAMKGVMLCHRNLVENALGPAKLNGISPKDVTLSILPLSHAFEQSAGFLHQLFHGSTIVYGRGPACLLEDLRVVRPTWMAVVPRILEKMCLAIRQGIEKKSSLGSRIFNLSLKRTSLYRKFWEKKNPLAFLFYLQSHLGDQIFYREIRKQLGGRLNRFVSGGARLDPTVGHFFEDIGIKILEGYGLTEASPVVTVNPIKKNKVGSAGLPLPNVKVRIGSEDEILVKGPSVMLGYDNNPKETRRVLDRRGWLHTGDQGYFDEEGYLFIKGRLKELIVLSTGKNVLPSVVEKQLEESPFLKQVMVYGEGRPYIIVLIVPDRTRLEGLFHTQEYFHLSWTQLCQHPKAQEFLMQEKKKMSGPLAQWERPKKLLVLPEEFTEHNSCLTPTLKLRRKVIEEKYRKEIERLYASAE